MIGGLPGHDLWRHVTSPREKSRKGRNPGSQGLIDCAKEVNWFDYQGRKWVEKETVGQLITGTDMQTRRLGDGAKIICCMERN